MDKTPAFNPPRVYEPSVISEHEYQKTLDKKLPEYVRCKVCRGKPEGLNWLKPVSPAPDCRTFIHLGCMSRDV